MLLTYQKAAEKSGFSVDRLRRAASDKTPLKKRLDVERLGHRTVRIKDEALSNWMERITR